MVHHNNSEGGGGGGEEGDKFQSYDFAATGGVCKRLS